MARKRKITEYEKYDTILVHSDGSLQIEFQQTEYFGLLPN